MASGYRHQVIRLQPNSGEIVEVVQIDVIAGVMSGVSPKEVIPTPLPKAAPLPIKETSRLLMYASPETLAHI